MTGGETCCPLTLTRSLEDFPIGNVPLAQHQCAFIEDGETRLHPHAWIDAGDWKRYQASGCTRLVSESAEPLLWRENKPGLESTFVASDSFVIRYPWDLLRANESFVRSLVDERVDGELHPSAVIEGLIQLGSGSRILPGVFIEGNVVIGRDCKIGPNCYVRGNTSIGDSCHIGQSVEIKNSLILSHTNVGHLSYVGDSVLGERVNLGAGTMVANLRHDGRNHRSVVGDALVDTGRRKFGVVIGDGVHTGIHTTIYPGRKLWPETSTRPGEIVARDVVN